MSSQQITHEVHPPRWKAAGIVLIALCVALMAYAVIAGLTLQPDYKQLGPAGLFDKYGAGGAVAFWLWLTSVPSAIILGVIGAGIAGRAKAGRIFALAMTGVAVLIIPVIVGALLGKVVAPIFGVGGVLIEILLVLTLVYWARERAGATGKQALALDLRIAGVMCFAFAAWFTCGIGAMPVLALIPEKMIEFDMLSLAIDMYYGMLAYLVMGFGFLCAGQYVAAKGER